VTHLTGDGYCLGDQASLLPKPLPGSDPGKSGRATSTNTFLQRPESEVSPHTACCPGEQSFVNLAEFPIQLHPLPAAVAVSHQATLVPRTPQSTFAQPHAGHCYSYPGWPDHICPLTSSDCYRTSEAHGGLIGKLPGRKEKLAGTFT
jgi:hypothetical protein